MIPTLRIMTRKSKLKFGKWAEMTVQQMLDLNKGYKLVAYYYCYSSVNYIENVLTELRITNEFRIPKPSKDIVMYRKFQKTGRVFIPVERGGGSDKLRKETKKLSKAYLQWKNQH